MLPKTLKGFTAFVDGRGYLGILNGGTPPKLTLKTEEHRGGGMDAPVELDVGMEKLEASLTFAEYHRDVAATFGRSDLPVTLRGSQEDEDGTVEAIEIQMRGLSKEIDPGDWSVGEKGEVKLSVGCRYYRLRIGGRVVHEIDVINGVRIIDGVDQLAKRRAALGA